MALLQNDKAIFYHPLDDSTESLKSQAWTLGSGSLAGAGKLSLALSGAAGDALSAFGAEAEFLAVSTDFISADAFSATSFVVAYKNAGVGTGAAKIGTVSGTDITFGAEHEFLSAGEATDMSVVALSSTKFVVAYKDAADSNHGTAKVGTQRHGHHVRRGGGVRRRNGRVPDLRHQTRRGQVRRRVQRHSGRAARHGKVGSLVTGADITASTPAAYDTAVAATKVAFVGWLKNP